MRVTVKGTRNRYVERESLPKLFVRLCNSWREELLRVNAADPVISVTGRRGWMSITLRSGVRWLVPAQDSPQGTKTYSDSIPPLNKLVA